MTSERGSQEPLGTGRATWLSVAIVSPAPGMTGGSRLTDSTSSRNPRRTRQRATLIRRREKKRERRRRRRHEPAVAGCFADVDFRETGEYCCTDCGTIWKARPIERPPGTGVGGFCRRKDTAFLSGCRRTFPVPWTGVSDPPRATDLGQGMRLAPDHRVRESARQKIRHISRSTYKRSGAQGDRAARRAATIVDKPRNNADPRS